MSSTNRGSKKLNKDEYQNLAMKDYLTNTTWHIPYTTTRCSCGKIFEHETDLMKHTDKHLPPEETKEKQLDFWIKVPN